MIATLALASASAVDTNFVLKAAAGGVLLGAAAAKGARPREFAKAVDAYQFVPPAAARPVATTLIAAEAAIGTLIFVPATAGWAAAAAALLFASFAVVLALNIARGNQAPCHCFGAESEQISGATLARSVSLMLASSAVLGFTVTGTGAPRGSDAVALGLIGLLVALLLWSSTLIPDVISYLRASPASPFPTTSKRVSLRNHPEWAAIFPARVSEQPVTVIAAPQERYRVSRG